MEENQTFPTNHFPPEDISSVHPHQDMDNRQKNLESHKKSQVIEHSEDTSPPKIGARRRISNRQSEQSKSERKSTPSSIEEKEEEEEEEEKESIYPSNILTLCMVVACLIALIAVYVYHRQPETSTSPSLFELYKAELVKMKPKYLNQSTRFWATFLSSLEPILTTDDPDFPAVIMLAVTETQHSMGLCFVKHLAEVLNKLLVGKNTTPMQLSYIDSSRLTTLTKDEQKLKIDEKIQKMIIENKQRTVIVDGLEKLHPESVIIFHAYCDNLEAVFKDIAIVFLLEIPSELNFTSDEQVYAYLFRLWDELGNGKTKALLARMANNVAIMQNVDHFIC